MSEYSPSTTGRVAVWFPAIHARTGADVFTQRLCDGLNARNIRAEITWLPPRSEQMPWLTPVPQPPAWASIVHINSWLHRRFVPSHLPVVTTLFHSVHDSALSPHKSPLQKLYHRLWIRPIEAWTLRRADAVTTISHYTADKMREAFGIRATYVIPVGMPMPGMAFSELKREPHQPFRLLFVGSWSRRKGVDLLGPIMDELGPAFELLYTAHSPPSIGMPANCRCIGRPDDHQLQQAYRDADALLFPTRLEGFGQVALEAMAYGLPVIATNGSALPEVVESGVSGILCPQDNVVAFAAAARKLRESPALWQSMSMAAMVCAHDPRFRIESMVDNYINVYENLCALSGRSASP